MSRLLVSALASAATVLAGTGAHAAAPGPLDRPCTHTAVPDTTPGANADMWVGPMQGGPIAQNGTLRCTIQLDAPQHRAPATEDIHLTATGTSGTTTIPPELMAYVKEPGQVAYLCTRFDDGGTVWYYDAIFTVWSTSPAVGCLPV